MEARLVSGRVAPRRRPVVPYDDAFPRTRSPWPCSDWRSAASAHGPAGAWTFSRQICLRETFEEILTHYAAGEDFQTWLQRVAAWLLLTQRWRPALQSGGRAAAACLPFVVPPLGNESLVLHRL